MKKTFQVSFKGCLATTMGPKPMMWWLVAILSVGLVHCQSNYEIQAPSTNYTLYNTIQDEGALPSFVTLNGTVHDLDLLPATVMLKKTKAVLNCSAGYMHVGMTFNKPFYGIVYADYDRNSACKMHGDGQTQGIIKLPLKGCGTVQSPARVFKNNIVVRFHPSFEIVGDEVITIICRYPTPIVPEPPVPAPIILPPPLEIRSLAPLKEFEVLLIVCAIIFLALMLLGIGCSYYCLKRRNIKVVKRRPASTLGSEITKISEPISMFDGLKIPRAHAEDTSGSEEMTESVRSEIVSDIVSTESEPDITSCYSDASFALPQGTVFAQLHAPPLPGFDVKTKVKRDHGGMYSDVESTATSESELVLKAQEQYLTTILERTETNTLETLERIRRAEAQAGPPPVHARVRVVNKAGISDHSELESESEYSQMSDYYHDKLRLATAEQTNFTIGVNDEALIRRQFEEEERLRDENVKRERIKLEEEIKQSRQFQQQQFQEQQLQQQQQQYHQEEQQQQYHQQQQQFQEQHLQQQYHHQSGQFQQQQFQEQQLQQQQQQYHHQQQQQQQRHSTEVQEHLQQQHQSDLITPVILERATANLRVSPPKNNFDVLIRVLDEPDYLGATADDDDVSSVLTEEERYRLREVIMTDEKIQTILKETHTTEQMLLIKDYRQIEKIIHPQKWDVLIRIIDNAGDQSAISGRKSSEDRSSTYGRKTTASSMTGQEMRSMSEVMVDYGYNAEALQETRSGYSGRSSTYTQAVSSTADRSGTEMVETDHYIESSASAAYNYGAGAASRSERRS
jgi:hypothetical protein